MEPARPWETNPRVRQKRPNPSSEGRSVVITFACTCGNQLQVVDESTGKKIECPECGQLILAPQPTAALAPPASAPTGQPPLDPLATASDSDVASRSEAKDETLGTSADQ